MAYIKKFREPRHVQRNAVAKPRRLSIGLAALAALAMLAAACGSTASDVEEVAGVTEQSTENSAASEPTAAPEATAAPEPTPEEESADSTDGALASDPEDEEAVPPSPVQVELGEADWTDMTEWTLGALGGLTFGVPADHVVHHDADMVTIRGSFDFDRGRYEPSMVIALTAQTAGGDPVTSIDDFTTKAIAGVGTAEPTNETLSLFGYELDGWRFTMNEDQPVGAHYLYAAYPVGTGGPTAWQPFPFAELFLAEVPEGVLAVGITARTVEELGAARGIFDRVAPTLELARSLDEPLPAVAALAGGPPEPPPEPVGKPDGWPSLLTGLSKPLDAGDYTVSAVSTAMSVTIDEGWWVQLNFPSWFIFSADESFGPGDRGMSMRTGMKDLVPTDRSGAVGEPVPFDFASLASAPPQNIEIVANEAVTVGGASGTRVRLQIAESAGCGVGDPCEYAITTIYPFPAETLRKGYTYDLWYLEGGLNEPLLILSMSPDDSWMPVAQNLVDTLTFNVTE